MISSCEDFSSVWSDLLVNSVKIEDDGDATDFENEDDFETIQELGSVNNLLGIVKYQLSSFQKQSITQ